MKTELEIQRLLDCWFSGETTLDEECALREFFRDDPRAANEAWAEVRELFGYLGEEARRQAPATRIRPLRWRHWAIIAAVAACVVVVCTVRIATVSHPAVPTQAIAWIDGEQVTDPDAILAEYHRIFAGINITDINTGAANPALTKTNRVFRKLEVIGRMQAALGKLGKYTTRIQSIDTFPNNEPSKTL